MTMNLADIKYEVAQTKVKKGVTKKISPEDQFMMASIQPAVRNAKYITIEYFICTELSYDGCTCCQNLPDARLPMTIVPMVNPACFGFGRPNGYEPILLGTFHVDPTFHH